VLETFYQPEKASILTVAKCSQQGKSYISVGTLCTRTVNTAM